MAALARPNNPALVGYANQLTRDKRLGGQDVFLPDFAGSSSNTWFMLSALSAYVFAQTLWLGEPMARDDVAALYRALRENKFSFIPRGEQHMDDIYAAVKRQFGELCDETYLCADNCSQGHQQAEWRHTTRKALWSLKTPGGAIRAGKARGYWWFD